MRVARVEPAGGGRVRRRAGEALLFEGSAPRLGRRIGCGRTAEFTIPPVRSGRRARNFAVPPVGCARRVISGPAGFGIRRGRARDPLFDSRRPRLCDSAGAPDPAGRASTARFRSRRLHDSAGRPGRSASDSADSAGPAGRSGFRVCRCNREPRQGAQPDRLHDSAARNPRSRQARVRGLPAPPRPPPSRRPAGAGPKTGSRPTEAPKSRPGGQAESSLNLSKLVSGGPSPLVSRSSACQCFRVYGSTRPTPPRRPGSRLPRRSPPAPRPSRWRP